MTTNNDNTITEVLEDGTIHHFDLDLCDDAAEEAIAILWEKENVVLNFDFTSAVFSTFVKSVGILTRSGWSTEELIQEVLNYSEADDMCDCDEDDNDDEDED